MTTIDYDLSACLEYNPQRGFTQDNIIAVLAVVEGERDQSDWHWVVQLDGESRYALIVGGYDYTGWDCQSSAVSVITTSAAEAASLDAVKAASAELARQVQSGMKSITWRELTAERFGNDRIISVVRS